MRNFVIGIISMVCTMSLFGVEAGDTSMFTIGATCAFVVVLTLTLCVLSDAMFGDEAVY